MVFCCCCCYFEAKAHNGPFGGVDCALRAIGIGSVRFHVNMNMMRWLSGLVWLIFFFLLRRWTVFMPSFGRGIVSGPVCK